MTVITVSTVGFNEVHPLSPVGRVFTITVIIGGVGTMLYTLGIFGELLADGKLAEYARRRRMERKMAGLSEHYIICGYGRIGSQVYQEFTSMNVPTVVVESNALPLAALRETDILHVEGDAASDEVLLRAGILRARGLVSCVDSDERNVFITLTARSLNPGLLIVARSGFTDSLEKLRRAGANQVVSPYKMGAHRMAALAVRPVVVDLLDTVLHGENIDLVIEELVILPGSALLGKTLGESGLRGNGANILAIKKKSGSLRLNPPDSIVLESDDLLVAIGTREQLNAAERMATP
jgi:voltage-gated potassium channel